MNEVLDFALRYAGAGYLVFPLKARNKFPLTQHGAVDATMDEATIRRWWGRWPTANIGMTLDGLVVVDIDPRNGGDLDDMASRLPETCYARTGGGGMHYLYRTVKGARYGRAEGLAGVDIKTGRNQYIVVEPSIHPTGEKYVWLDESEPWGTKPALAPAWLAQTPPERAAPARVQTDTDLLRDLRSALKVIPSDDRDEWVRIGHALKMLGEPGRLLWVDWSATSDKYDPADAERVWSSMRPSATGYAAVFEAAQKRGWVNPAKGRSKGAGRGKSASPPRGVASDAAAPPPPGDAPTDTPLAIDTKAPLAVARLFQRELFTVDNRRTLHYWQGEFYKHAGAAYAPCETTALRGALYPFLESCVSPSGEPIKPTRRLVDDVQDAYRAISFLDVAQAPAWLDGHPPYPLADLIPCANGIVHVPSRRLLAATPALFNLNATTFNFDPKAPRPKAWLVFLASVFDEDDEAIGALQEFTGLSLTTDTSYQKALLVVGPKRSGKGTIARVLTGLVGTANTAAPTLAGLGGQFGLQALINKQLAIVSDARLGGRADIHAVTENMLRVTGEDFIGVPRKFLADFTARLPVRFIIMTNEVPALADSSGALPSRFITLRLTKSFYGMEDTGLTNRLLEELPGIFLWALEGLDRLRVRGAFVQPASGRAMLRQLDELASPIKAFMGECCITDVADQDDWVECSALYEAWRQWCRDSGREHPGTRQLFGRNLSAAIQGVESKQVRRNGAQVRVYPGVRLRTEAEKAEAAE